MGDMGGRGDVHVVHDDAASYFAEGVNNSVLSDAGGGEDACMWSYFAAIADDHGSDDVAACVDLRVLSYADGSFDGDTFFDGAAGVFACCLDHRFVDGDEIPGINDVHP